MYHQVPGTDSPPRTPVMSCDVESQLAIEENNHGRSHRLRCRSCAEICEICSTDGCFKIWLLVFLALTMTWWLPLIYYQDAQYVADYCCDQKVTAFVIRQHGSTVYDTCDLTLSWKDTHELPRESVIRWGCDPFYPSDDGGRRDVLFSQPTCYNNGERDLRVMGISDYDIFDNDRQEFVKGSQSYYTCPSSPLKVFVLKWTWIVLLSAWIVSALPLVGFLVMLVCQCVWGIAGVFLIYDYE